jgi:hypothetical protein
VNLLTLFQRDVVQNVIDVTQFTGMVGACRWRARRNPSLNCVTPNVIKTAKIKLILVDLESEEVIQWIR